jgi:polysaccharide export outer membrane protein
MTRPGDRWRIIGVAAAGGVLLSLSQFAAMSGRMKTTTLPNSPFEIRRFIALKTILTRRGRRAFAVLFQLLLPGLILLAPGCQTTPPPVPPNDSVRSGVVVLREGDTIKIAFPGAPNLDTTQQVRRDGKITLSLGGEVVAVGKTPAELEKEVLKLYDTQLTVKQVVVTVTSATFPVFVSGAVLKPGKILADRPITVLEAIMEAGGFDQARANLKKVAVLREIDGKITSYPVDMGKVFTDATSKPFYLKPGDIVHVPQKFNWF